VGVRDRSVTAANNGEPLTQFVARQLRERIADGRLKPDIRIPQRTVAHEFGVSRIPVREALRQLESEGLVVIRPNSGARVAVLDFEECVQMYKIREQIEPLAFRESIGHITSEQIEEVRRLAARIELLTSDHDAWLDGDRRFHLASYGGLSTGRLLAMTIGFWNTTQHYRRALLTTYSKEDFEVAHAEHRLILHALATNNPDAGVRILQNAIERSRFRLADHRDLFSLGNR
jgi:DNA-binding GntR family transcriptional regulator